MGRAWLLAALILLAGAAGASGLALPAPAPALRLMDVDGRPLDLGRLRGRVVLLDFWATWCGPCRDEVPALRALQSRYGPRGLSIVGLSLDESAAPVRAFRRAAGFNYPVALAGLSVTARFGGVLGLPTLYLVDRRGMVVRRFHDAESRAGLAAAIEAALAAEAQ